MEISQIKLVLNQPTIGEPAQKPLKGSTQTKESHPPTKEPVKEIQVRQQESIQELAETLNKFIERINYNLQFIPDQEAGGVIIKVLDREGNLIRQIPPEAFLALSSKIGDHIGILINSKL